MTSTRFVRCIDALDLMIKSGWRKDAAKKELAGQIASSAMLWNAEWGVYFNPSSGKVETISGDYQYIFAESPISIMFRTIEKRIGSGNESIYCSCLVRHETPGFVTLDKEGKFGTYGLRIGLTNWQTGSFRVVGHDTDLFFGLNGLSVGREDLRKLLTVDIMELYSHVLDFDLKVLGLTWVNTLPASIAVTSALPANVQPPAVVSVADLNRWWQGLTESREPLSIRALWVKAKLDFPGNTVPRRAIERLASGRKRGRKPNLP